MLTPDVHPPRPGEPAAELDRAHHDHGPLGGDDFIGAAYAPMTVAQLAACIECGWMGPGCCLAQ